MQARLRKILFIALGGLITLGFGEGFTRVFLSQNTDTVLDILVPDQTVGYRYAANINTRETSRE